MSDHHPVPAGEPDEPNDELSPWHTGRPTILTEEITEQICGYLREGMFLEAAVDLAGMKIGTVYEWIARGEGRHREPPRPIYTRFAEAVRRASAEREQIEVRRILRAEPGWQAIAWFLERRYPTRYGNRKISRVEDEKVGRAIAQAMIDLVHDPDVDMSDEQREIALGKAENLLREISAGGD